LRLHFTKKQIIEIKARFNVDIEISPKTLVALAPIESFEDMNLHPNIMKDIAFHSYTTPTPIQAQALFMALSSHDLLGCTKTGYGKTTTFALLFI
jgi:ATP-dependent RNA helicase DDX5/DBP2